MGLASHPHSALKCSEAAPASKRIFRGNLIAQSDGHWRKFVLDWGRSTACAVPWKTITLFVLCGWRKVSPGLVRKKLLVLSPGKPVHNWLCPLVAEGICPGLVRKKQLVVLSPGKPGHNWLCPLVAEGICPGLVRKKQLLVLSPAKPVHNWLCPLVNYWLN